MAFFIPPIDGAHVYIHTQRINGIWSSLQQHMSLFRFAHILTRYQHPALHWANWEKEEIDDISKSKMPKRSPKMLQLRRLLREQLLEALLAPMRRSRRRGRRGIAPANGARRVDDLAACQPPHPVPPDHCTAVGRILMSSPRHCLSHGWTARVRVEHGGSPAASATHGVASPRRSVMPRRSSSPVYSPIHMPVRSASPTYSTATPQYTPTPLEPPGFELPRTRAARRGALPFYDEGESYVTDEVVFDEPELAPPPPPQAPAAVDELGIAEPAMAPPLPIPPPPPVPARRKATAAANRRPGLHGFFPTGASLRGPEACPPRSGKGEA